MPVRNVPANPCSGVPVSFCSATGQAGSKKAATAGALWEKHELLARNLDSHPMTRQASLHASNFVHGAERRPHSEGAPPARGGGVGLELGIAEEATQQLSIDDALD